MSKGPAFFFFFFNARLFVPFFGSFLVGWAVSFDLSRWEFLFGLRARYDSTMGKM